MNAGALAAMIWRATVEAVEDSGALQLLTLGGFLGKGRTAERLQQYGLTSVPLKDSEALVFQVNGDASALVVSVVDCSAARPKDLQPGEVCLYTDEGDRIHFKRGHKIIIQTSGQILLGDEEAADEVARKSDLAAIVSDYNSHTHVFSAYIPGAGSAAPATIPAIASPLSVPACSSKVKAE